MQCPSSSGEKTRGLRRSMARTADVCPWEVEISTPGDDRLVTRRGGEERLEEAGLRRRWP